MFKRVGLFLITNLLIVAMITIVTQLFGIEPYLEKGGYNYEHLLIFCALFGFGGAFISLAISRFMAKKMMGVQLIDERTSDRNLQWVKTKTYELAAQAGIEKMPEVGFYVSPEANAFATGPTRNRALVAVSTGLLQQMNQDQVEGVLAHEIGHIANGDMVTMTLIQGVVNTFVMFFARIIANILTANLKDGARFAAQLALIMLFQMIFGLLGSMVVAYFSRRREYRADEAGAILAGKEKMASALDALRVISGRGMADEPKQFATLKISGKMRSPLANLFSTHPDINNRIAAVRNLKVA